MKLINLLFFNYDLYVFSFPSCVDACIFLKQHAQKINETNVPNSTLIKNASHFICNRLKKIGIYLFVCMYACIVRLMFDLASRFRSIAIVVREPNKQFNVQYKTVTNN